jgi:hypothetical protein
LAFFGLRFGVSRSRAAHHPELCCCGEGTGQQRTAVDGRCFASLAFGGGGSSRKYYIGTEEGERRERKFSFVSFSIRHLGSSFVLLVLLVRIKMAKKDSPASSPTNNNTNNNSNSNAQERTIRKMHKALDFSRLQIEGNQIVTRQLLKHYNSLNPIFWIN